MKDPSEPSAHPVLLDIPSFESISGSAEFHPRILVQLDRSDQVLRLRLVLDEIHNRFQLVIDGLNPKEIINRAAEIGEIAMTGFGYRFHLPSRFRHEDIEACRNEEEMHVTVSEVRLHFRRRGDRLPVPAEDAYCSLMSVGDGRMHIRCSMPADQDECYLDLVVQVSVLMYALVRAEYLSVIRQEGDEVEVQSTDLWNVTEEVEQ